ncbi:hypothetical protein ACLQ28_14385 [Micromonospora sp. DT201]|uniref:hypothetical protein n=1 Tax=Micromonospora sp. DT201 TaxID=3393442 RepID=UPI003CEEF633
MTDPGLSEVAASVCPHRDRISAPPGGGRPWLTAHLHNDNPDPEQAAGLALQALALSADHHYESVNQRAHQFLTTARPFANMALMRRVAEQVDTRARTSRRGGRAATATGDARLSG